MSGSLSILITIGLIAVVSVALAASGGHLKSVQEQNYTQRSTQEVKSEAAPLVEKKPIDDASKTSVTEVPGGTVTVTEGEDGVSVNVNIQSTDGSGSSSSSVKQKINIHNSRTSESSSSVRIQSKTQSD